MLSPARLGQGLERLSQQPPRPRPRDVPGENQKQLRVPIEGFGELHERLSSRPLDLARLNPTDLRSRETTPPRQPPHRQTRTHARLPDHPGQRRQSLFHRGASLAPAAPSIKYLRLPPKQSNVVT